MIHSIDLFVLRRFIVTRFFVVQTQYVDSALMLCNYTAISLKGVGPHYGTVFFEGGGQGDIR